MSNMSNITKEQAIECITRFKKIVRNIKNKVMFKYPNFSLFAEAKNGFYVVYSYGYHWPLWAFNYKSGVWYENSTRSSRTTNRHRRVFVPDWGSPPVYLGSDRMLELVAAEHRVPVENKWKEMMEGWRR